MFAARQMLILALVAAVVPSEAARAQSAQAAGPATAGAAPKLGGSIVRDCAREARARPDEIIVCGDRGERSPYRLPEAPPRFDPGAGVDSVSRERHRLYEVGETGTHSCSAVGPGGWTGCTFKRWKDAREQWGK